jgi:LysR family glycine cleavage system transcriptional activator
MTMSLSRRFLPSTNALVAFEVAARLQSFSAAAQELCLTQSAVSRQIQALEAQLGTPLFVRERQTVRLTSAGDVYAREIRASLAKISAASRNASEAPSPGGVLNLAILPTFGTRWLTPRLPRFHEANPGICLKLTTRFSPFDFRFDPLDAAIHFGAPEWAGADLAFLMRETVLPACSQAFAEKYRFREPTDLARAPLLHLASRPDAWNEWFARCRVQAPNRGGMIFDQFSTVAEAAISGLGLALLPRFLVEDELRRGDLVPALDLLAESASSYYLVWPTVRTTYPPHMTFRYWLIRESAAVCAEGRNTLGGLSRQCRT